MQEALLKNHASNPSTVTFNDKSSLCDTSKIQFFEKQLHELKSQLETFKDEE